MNLGIVTYSKAPYRKKQFEKILEIKNIKLNIYYCKEKDRKWNLKDIDNITEKVLKYLFKLNNDIFLNWGLIDIVKHNDILIIGGYEQPTYIILSILCRLYKKPYIILFDGISRDKLIQNKNTIKYKIKKFVINSSNAIWANGEISRKYFLNNFKVNDSSIYNQYLTIDSDFFKRNNYKSDFYKSFYRKKYGISNEKKVLFYSGRLIKLKNIDSIINAISLLDNKQEYILFIAGGGEEKEYLISLAKEKKVNLIITGFIENQEELFKHYYLADVFTIMSLDEAWGLAINEAMYAKLPVVVSYICGASLDLIKNNVNGFTVNPRDINEISNAYKKIFSMDLKNMGEYSFKIIQKWSFDNSKKELERLLNNIKNEV